MNLFGAMRLPRSVLFGSGQREAIGAIAAQMGSRILICTDARLGADAQFKAIVADAYAACDGADVLAVLTEWDEFRWVEPGKVSTKMIGREVIDARNLLDRADWQRAGFRHQGIGR